MVQAEAGEQILKKCARDGCMNQRESVNGVYANYCSKVCEGRDMSKGALVKNQDAIYREAAMRAKSRSKSPITGK